MDQESQKSRVTEILGRIQKLPSLPNVVVEILHHFENENVDVSTLAKNIANDQALVARVMRVANSPFFGLSGQIETLFEAISVLGFNNLRGLVTAAAFINNFPDLNKRFDWNSFWRHSIATAVCAKVLAKKAGLNPETAFTAGLLHDIGKLVMGVYFPESFSRTLEVVRASTAETLAAERLEIGVDHAELGREIAERWRFPANIREAIGLHHTAEKRDKPIDLADVVYTANLFSHGIGLTKQEEPTDIAAVLWLRLGLESHHVPVLTEEIKEMYASVIMLIA
jgi:putative nucleotidyltransferase with HDIG domain